MEVRKIIKPEMGKFELNPFSEIPLKREDDPSQDIKVIGKCLPSFHGG